MYKDPKESDVVCLDQESSVELLTKFPEFAAVYDSRMDMMEEIVRQFSHDRDFFYLDEEGGVPPYVVEAIVWRVSREFVSKISEVVLKSLSQG